jgi:hypothetical protein
MHHGAIPVVLGLILATVASVSPVAAQDPRNLSGAWRDQKGRSYEVAHRGSEFTLLARETGRVFKGTLVGDRITLVNTYETLEQVPEDVRDPDLRQRLVGKSARFQGRVSPDGSTIDAELIVPRAARPQNSRVVVDAPPVTVPERLERPGAGSRIRFLVEGSSGPTEVKSLAVGVPVVVELVFDRPPAGGGDRSVEITVGSDRVTLTARPVRGDPRRFRTDPVLPWPADDILGPPPPRFGSTPDRGRPGQ